MQIPLKIVTREASLPDPMTDHIRERVDKLETFFSRILGCRVTVEGPGGHHRSGRYRVHIVVTVPGAELVINRKGHDDPEVAIHEAFDAADRKLEDYARRLRGEVKARETAQEARVARIFAERGFGFIESDGREIYFHRNSVLPPGFDRLEVGTRVRFTEEQGDQGPQASTVSILGTSH
ncbi:MAG: HPF/RaiA family ribosome-associated protein [Planctomycetes bacterium]|nr:HPF/RaiA family ribosome-associated protein [Planctomycetota bacterium]